MKIFPAIAFILFLFSSCIKDLPGLGLLGIEGPYGNLNERTARPLETDQNISTLTPGNNLQYAYVSKIPGIRVNRLFVMLPGTLSNPSDYQLILKAAASHGYHSLSVAYNNLNTIDNLCDDSSDPECAEKALYEFLTGTNTSGQVDVNSADSFENRILKMLIYLNSRYPGDGWAQYLVNGEINWKLISLGGHSQGGTHALFISRKRPLLRASFYSSPNGFKKNGSYPGWVTQEGLTDNSRLYAFIHTADRLIEWKDALKTWNAAGIGAGTASVDMQKDFSNANRFYTSSSNLLNLLTGAHGATCTDKDTPLNRDRKPKFENVWQKMSFPKP